MGSLSSDLRNLVDVPLVGRVSLLVTIVCIFWIPFHWTKLLSEDSEENQEPCQISRKVVFLIFSYMSSRGRVILEHHGLKAPQGYFVILPSLSHLSYTPYSSPRPLTLAGRWPHGK